MEAWAHAEVHSSRKRSSQYSEAALYLPRAVARYNDYAFTWKQSSCSYFPGMLKGFVLRAKTFISLSETICFKQKFGR
eukprot:1676597-Pleurochrysis_carterae.AAC.2